MQPPNDNPQELAVLLVQLIPAASINELNENPGLDDLKYMDVAGLREILMEKQLFPAHPDEQEAWDQLILNHPECMETIRSELVRRMKIPISPLQFRKRRALR